MALTTTPRPLTTPRHRPPAAVRRRRALVLVLAALVVAVTSAWALTRESAQAGPAEAPATTEPGSGEKRGIMSQNGWPAITEGDDLRLVPFPWVTGRVLDGDVSTVLAHFAERFDAEVEPIDVASSWAWAYRPVRGHDDTLSNHASGTAIDLNATIHPLGSTDTFSDDQVDRLRELLDELAPVLAWGGDFERPDEMHFEVVGTPEQVAEVAARL